MLPFRHRVVVVLWVIWLVWCAPVFWTLLAPYATARSEEFSSSHAPSTFVLPAAVVEAYQLGRMSDQERREFEIDLRSGQVSVPSGMSVTIPARYPDLTGIIGNFALLVFLPGLAVTLFQFLLVGFFNPSRLLSLIKVQR